MSDMGKSQKQKGDRGELEVLKILKAEIQDAINLSKNYAQRANGGVDIHGIQGWAVEVKRQKLYRSDWMDQAIANCGICEKPVVLYRLDRKPWMAEVLAGDIFPSLSSEKIRNMRISLPLHVWINMFLKNEGE